VSAGPNADPTGRATPRAIAAPAATVVLLRPGPRGAEVLLTHRPTTMTFAAGMQVFPGGRVDSADHDPRLIARSARGPADAAHALGGNVAPGEGLALHVAAIRELFEEAGILLADGAEGETAGVAAARSRLLGGTGLADALDGMDLRLRTDRLVPIAHWTTPRFMPRRFSTWFFVADVPPDAQASFEGDEVLAHRWVTPAAALDQLAEGEIEMWVPTSSVLQRLVEMRGSSAAAIGARLAPGPTPPPRVVREDPTIVRFAFGSMGALPGRSGTTTLHGRRELILVDPGDPSDAALDTIAAAVARRDGVIRAIVLTATDPDHAAGAEAVAIPLEIPILVAPGAGRHLPYATRELADDEALPADVKMRVRLGPPASGRLEVVGP
jgi:8-oxo-dGTP pyrophosphatase MutT (NUDIX family)